MSGRAEALVLVALCAVLYLAGAAETPFYTRGEPREGNVVREMLATGEWVVPARPEGEPARKPALYYWLGAVALRALPAEPELALRLPSATLGTAAVVGVWGVTRAVVAPAAGLPAALVLATAFEWVRASTVARVDMALAASLTLVLAAWAMALVRPRAAWFAAAAAGVAAGVLAKGPVALVLPALALVAYAGARRDLRVVWRFRPVLVLGVGLAVGAAWYAAAFAREGQEYLAVVVRENLLRFVDPEGGRTGHAQPTWYLVLLGLVGLLPWTPLLPLAAAPLATRPRPPVIVFAATWAVVVLVFFSLAAAKRSVYLLPLFPALALLIAAGVVAPGDGRAARIAAVTGRLYAPGLVLLALVGAAYAGGLDPSRLLVSWLREDDRAGAAAFAATAARAAGPLLVLAAASAGAAFVVARAVRRADWQRVVTVVAAVTVGWVAGFGAWFHPAIARDRSLRQFMREVDRLVPAGETLHAFYPPDPGLRFYAPRPLRVWPKQGARFLLLWEDEWRRLRGSDDRPLAPLAVSAAEQSGRGHLTLVTPPPGPLHRAPPGSPTPSPGTPELGRPAN